MNCAAIALCNGFQPLVTSNNAKALVPFKEKLPVALRKLCIDISSFDEGSTAGLRQALVALREEVAGVKERKEEYEQEVKVCGMLELARYSEECACGLKPRRLFLFTSSCMQKKYGKRKNTC